MLICDFNDVSKIIWNKMRFGEPIEIIIIVDKYVHTLANFLNSEI